MVVTLLLFSNKGMFKALESEEDMLCGHIECKKDTCNVLERTMAGPINDLLKACGKELVFLEHDGRRLVEWGLPNAQKTVDENPGAKTLHFSTSGALHGG